MLRLEHQRLRAHQANWMAIIAWVATDPSVGQNRDSKCMYAQSYTGTQTSPLPSETTLDRPAGVLSQT